jgi:hypothetical protein
MAHPNVNLINALRETAERLRKGAHYAWGHHGACNCGNLLQTITPLSENEIRKAAHESIGEWTELFESYCPSTGSSMDFIASRLKEVGLTGIDMRHIEYLSDKEVLQHLEGGFRWLKRNKKEDAIAYFEAFANLLEEKWAASIPLSLQQLLDISPSTSSPLIPKAQPLANCPT